MSPVKMHKTPPRNVDHSSWTCSSKKASSSPSQPGIWFHQPKAHNRFQRLPSSFFKLNLKSKKKVSDISFNKIKYNNQLTKHSFNAKIDRMNSHTYLLIILGLLPPSKLERWYHLRDMCAWMWAPIKMKDIGSRGENTVVLHHIPGHDQHLCWLAKEPTKAQIFRQAREQLPKPSVCPTI